MEMMAPFLWWHTMNLFTLASRKPSLCPSMEVGLAGYREDGFSDGRACTWISSSDRQSVGSGHDDTVAGVVDMAEISRIESETEVVEFARVKMHSLEAPECKERCAGQLGEVEVKLDDLVTLARAGVLHIDIDIERVAGR